MRRVSTSNVILPTHGTGVVRRGSRQTGVGRRDGHVPPGEALRIPTDTTAIFKADTVTETGNMDARGVGSLPAQLAREGKLADYVNATFGIDAA